MPKNPDEGRWYTNKFDPIEKDVALHGPSGFLAQIDYDDVDHKTVKRVAARMVAILNKHWLDPEVQ